MQIRRTEGAVSFNVWTSQRTWFWSLMYPDREGGAISAAPSEAEALDEAHTAIERLLQPRDTAGILPAPCEDSRFTQRYQSSKDSRFHIGRKMKAADGDAACSRGTSKRQAQMPTMDQSYNNLWQLTLQQYAARVADA